MYDITSYGAATSLADNSSAINNAIFSASSAGGGTVLVPVGRWKVTAPINLLKGVNLLGDGDVIYNWASASLSGGSIIEFDHTGVGIFQHESTTIANFGFDYPGQLSTLSIPLTYGATIQLAGTAGNIDQKIVGNWFHKSYLAMDLRGSVSGFSSSGLTVSDNTGCPIYIMAVDYVADWQSFRNNKFNAGKINPSATTSGLVAWVANNAIGIQLFGNDWVTLDGIEIWGYHTGVYIVPGYGYAGTGPYMFQNCSFDACQTPIQLAGGVYHNIVKASDCTFTAYNYVTNQKGAVVAFSPSVDMSDGGLIFSNNYVFGPHNQVLWAGNSVQKPSNMIISGNICHATGGDWAVWSDKGNNVQVMNNIFRGYAGLVNLNTTTNGVVTNNQS